MEYIVNLTGHNLKYTKFNCFKNFLFQNNIETEISYEAILISFEKIKATIYIKNNEKFILINERGDISLSKLI